MGRDTRESANELRSVAPLVVTGASMQLVGACTLVSYARHTIAFASAELLRQAGEPLAICTKLDGSQTVPVPSWALGRHPGLGLIDLGAQAFDVALDVAPLALESVCASVETRGAPAGLVVVAPNGRGFSRRVIPVHVDAIDGGGINDDVIARLASPSELSDADAAAEGAPLFAWMPPDPVLGRASEVVVVALGVTYRARTFKPRPLAAIAELVGLEDLGRMLLWDIPEAEDSNELGQVAGEIPEAADARDPRAGLDRDD